MLFDISVTDTREAEQTIVRNVEADTIEEACQKVAKKKGFLWVGTQNEGEISYAIDKAYYDQWHHGINNSLDEDIELVRLGDLDEFRGLYSLYENDITLEEYVN